jgi:hypothetical protein
MMRLLYSILFICTSLAGQQISFDKEDITFYLDSEFIKVVGNYWFSNQTNELIESDIYYPFPHSAGKAIDSISVYNLSKVQELPFQRENKFGLSFYLITEPSDTVICQIKYRQALNSDSAVYILESTKSWNLPLNFADFKLVIPDSLNITKFSYPPDKSYEIEKFKIYLWKRKNFMPDQNMIFHF